MSGTEPEGDLLRKIAAAEKTVEVLKRKVFELYNGERSAIQKQLDAARRREDENRRRRELAEVRAGELARYSQTLEAEVARRTEAIKTILNNVTFGFLVVGRDLVVHPETTRSCTGLFQTEHVEGRPLAELLRMTPRRAQEFALACEQVFEDFLPPEVSLGQMPQKFPAEGGRILRAEGSVIRDASGEVSAMLFTISDITALEEATRESNNNRTLVGILRQKDAFLAFLAETRLQLHSARAAVPRGEQALVRRVVHTVKGNAASYGLLDIVDLCHDIEEGPAVDEAALDQILGAFRSFLEHNQGVLEIDFDRVNEQAFEVSAEQMEQFRAILRDLRGDVPERLRRWTARVLSKPAATLMGPVEDFTLKLAERLHKRLDFRLEGADLPLDVATMRPVVVALPHLIRNAVDHGVEHPHERGGKGPVGRVRVAVREDSSRYHLIVEDDGRGIDLPAVRVRAVERGFVSSEAASTMTDGGLSLIFLDGLSTAPVTTSISGRGIGMSAVKSAVEEAAGSIHIETAPGKGTTFTISVPKPLFSSPLTREKPGMTNEPQAQTEQMVVDAAISLFSANGIELREIPRDGHQPTKANVAGLIGFTGENLRGTLMLASSFSFFAGSRPPEVRSQQLSEFVARDWLMLRDWAAELANQLLGRVKNKLFSYGVSLRVSTPTALSGAALAVSTPTSKRTAPRVLAAGNNEVWLWWDVVLEPDFKLEQQEEQAATEGDVLLFLGRL